MSRCGDASRGQGGQHRRGLHEVGTSADDVCYGRPVMPVYAGARPPDPGRPRSPGDHPQAGSLPMVVDRHPGGALRLPLGVRRPSSGPGLRRGPGAPPPWGSSIAAPVRMVALLEDRRSRSGRSRSRSTVTETSPSARRRGSRPDRAVHLLPAGPDRWPTELLARLPDPERPRRPSRIRSPTCAARSTSRWAATRRPSSTWSAPSRATPAVPVWPVRRRGSRASWPSSIRIGDRLLSRSAPSGATDAIGGRILHLVSISLPHAQVGYTVRSQNVARCQQAAGLDPRMVTRAGFPGNKGVRGAAPRDEVDGVVYERIRPDLERGLPLDRVATETADGLAGLIGSLRPAVLQPATRTTSRRRSRWRWASVWTCRWSTKCGASWRSRGDPVRDWRRRTATAIAWQRRSKHRACAGRPGS